MKVAASIFFFFFVFFNKNNSPFLQMYNLRWEREREVFLPAFPYLYPCKTNFPCKKIYKESSKKHLPWSAFKVNIFFLPQAKREAPISLNSQISLPLPISLHIEEPNRSLFHIFIERTVLDLYNERYSFLF
jgi:hypothetical protein